MFKCEFIQANLSMCMALECFLFSSIWSLHNSSTLFCSAVVLCFSCASPQHQDIDLSSWSLCMQLTGLQFDGQTPQYINVYGITWSLLLTWYRCGTFIHWFIHSHVNSIIELEWTRKLARPYSHLVWLTFLCNFFQSNERTNERRNSISMHAIVPMTDFKN